MAVLRVQASLSARPGPGFTVKRPEEDWQPLPFHSSKPYICFFLLGLSDSLSFSSLCPSPCRIPSFFSQQRVKCSLVSQPAVPSHFLSSLFFHHIPLFLPVPFSASVSHSCSFSPSFPSSDYYSDTAYPAVISLITFKQLSVAFSPSIGLPLHSLSLIACSFLCQCLEGNIFHYLTTRHKYSYSAFIFDYRWILYM